MDTHTLKWTRMLSPRALTVFSTFLGKAVAYFMACRCSATDYTDWREQSQDVMLVMLVAIDEL
jgi:hypothetical protein